MPCRGGFLHPRDLNEGSWGVRAPSLPIGSIVVPLGLPYRILYMNHKNYYGAV